MAGPMMTLSVEHDDGESTVYPVLPVTIVAFERQFKRGIGSMKDDAHMEYVYWLGWDAEKRAGKVVKPFDGWLETVTSVEIEDDAVPLDEGPSPAS